MQHPASTVKILAPLACLCAAQVFAEALPVPGQAQVGARLGSDTQEYLLDGLMPLHTAESSVLQLNLRGSFLEDAEQEANGGLVFRRLLSKPAAILGANLYYDHRWTENDQTFGQVGAGLEWLSRVVDARANLYHPLDDAKVISETRGAETIRQGRDRVTTETTRRIYEEALPGFDAEIGVWIPGLPKDIPAGLFVGYYDFSSDYGEDISGVKARLEMRLSSNFIIDAEWYEDDRLNDTEYFAGLRVVLPFGKGGDSGPPGYGRLNEMVHRDFRIRTVTTAPQVATAEVDRETVRQNQPPPPPSSPAPRAPSATPPKPPAPKCYLNDDGDVVCQ
jgi:hypothetical protein